MSNDYKEKIKQDLLRSATAYLFEVGDADSMLNYLNESFNKIISHNPQLVTLKNNLIKLEEVENDN